MSNEQTNALGHPSPNRTDFKNWSREGLEAFARQAADENLVLQANVAALLQQWRDVTIAVAEEREACLRIADDCADADMHASMAANAIRTRRTQ